MNESAVARLEPKPLSVAEIVRFSAGTRNAHAFRYQRLEVKPLHLGLHGPGQKRVSSGLVRCTPDASLISHVARAIAHDGSDRIDYTAGCAASTNGAVGGMRLRASRMASTTSHTAITNNKTTTMNSM